jgi:hypothetical protein
MNSRRSSTPLHNDCRASNCHSLRNGRTVPIASEESGSPTTSLGQCHLGFFPSALLRTGTSVQNDTAGDGIVILSASEESGSPTTSLGQCHLGFFPSAVLRTGNSVQDDTAGDGIVILSASEESGSPGATCFPVPARILHFVQNDTAGANLSFFAAPGLAGRYSSRLAARITPSASA